MKPKLRLLKALAPVCFALALAIPQAQAQSKSQHADVEPQIKYDLEVTAGGALIDNGRPIAPTLGNAIDILRRLHPELTFALSPGLGDVKLAELKLHANDVDQTLEALRLATGNRFDFAAPAHSSGGDHTLYLLQGIEPPNRRRMVEAFNLGDWISGARSDEEKGKRVRQLEEIIYTTIEKLRESSLEPNDRPEILFHPEANIMVVIGTPQSIEVAGKLARALNPSPYMNSSYQGMSGILSSQGGGVGGGLSMPASRPGIYGVGVGGGGIGGGGLGSSLPGTRPENPAAGNHSESGAPSPNPGTAPKQ